MNTSFWIYIYREPILRAVVVMALVVPSLISAQVSLGQQLTPVNDNLANAQVLNIAGSVVTGTNVAATKQTGEPGHGENMGGASVWYRYDSQSNGILVLSTLGSAFDTTMAVYTGTNIANLNYVSSSDDISESSLFSNSSRIRLGVAVGKTYYIAIDGKNNGTGATTGDLQLSYVLENASSNDNFAGAYQIYNSYGRLHTNSNVGASKEIGEPNHGNNPGGKSVWYKWISPAGGPKSFSFELRTRSLAGESTFVSAMAVYTGTSLSELTLVKENFRQYLNRVTFIAEPSTTYYIAVDGADSGIGAATGNFVLSYGPTKTRKQGDFDRDGKADPSVFRPTTGVWYSLNSTTGTMEAFNFGTNGDKPLVGDFNPADGDIDHTVYRPDTGVWYTNRANLNSFTAAVWGSATDIPLMRLEENQLSQRITIYRPETSTFWQRNLDGTAAITHWGLPGDIPMIADFNGDSFESLAVFRPSNGVWYIRQTASAFEAIEFGQAGDIPVPADYDGDGLIDLAVFRPSTATWWIRRTTDDIWAAIKFGISTDRPQPADYDGDGKDDLALYRGGTWWILNSSNGSVRVVQFGLEDDIPIASPVGLL